MTDVPTIHELEPLVSNDRLTWREQLVIRILLLIARMVADSPLADDLRHLSNHVTTTGTR